MDLGGVNIAQGSFQVKKAFMLGATLALMLATAAFSQSSSTKVAPPRDVRTTGPVIGRTGGILKQDLFDRNNPSNLRNDWPAPPAQPGQF
jgi:hypothetical protein